jgi:hypothetical protein
MKSVIALLPVVAAAVPRIELDLSGVQSQKLGTSIYRAHDLGRAQPDGTAVLSRQDWTEKCEAGTSTTTATCPFPVAKAFDHQDKAVQVTTRVFLVDVNGHTCGTASGDHADCKALCEGSPTCQVSSVSFGQRSTYLFKYDATDAAGNHAEQVVFALILDDAVAPKLVVCDGDAETVEAASTTWKLCASSTADDLIDGNIKSSITYDIQNMDASGSYLCTAQSYATYVAYLAAPTGTEPCATQHLATKNVGRYLVTFKVCDSAGVYGVNSQNNCVTAHKAVLIKDTLAPWIDVHGAEPTVHECGVTYTDQGATVKDLLDTEALKRDLQVTPYLTVTQNVEDKAVDDYHVTYNAQDYAGNVAETKTRNVWVRDTTKPVMVRSGDAEVVHYSCDPNHPDRDASHAQHVAADARAACPADFPADPANSVTCEDSCGTWDAGKTGLELTPVRTWNRPFNERVLGDYIRTYTCTDAAGNANSVTRKFTIEDKDSPVIQVMGSDDETYDASNTVEYTDKGATCEDYVDGVLSHAVEVSGQVVNMRIPGVYTISYDCQDLSGNQAKQMHRKVTISDTSCPTIQLNGQSVVYVEAGFEYNDAGATANDDLDGDITSKVWKDGDTVTTSGAFYSRRSCREIKSQYAAAQSGEYYITTYIAASQSFQRTLVHCDMHSKNGAGKTPGYTYYGCDGCDRVTPYGDAQGDCPARGLEMAKFATVSDAATKTWASSTSNIYFGASYFPADATAKTDKYLCSTNDQSTSNNAETAHAHALTHDQIERAEAGKYVINYHVEDSSGNPECASPSRTVIVRDTLPPVITLHLRNKLIHMSDASQTGLGTQANPAGTNENPQLKADYTPTTTTQNSFMAEESSSSVNGWVLAAVASTVSGLALLSMTLRKPTTTVEV